MVKCPGQDQRYWKPEDINEVNCPECGSSIEFWKDEPRRKCSKCSKIVWNPRIDLGCAEWCQYADQCVGELLENKEAAVLCDKLVAEMKGLFGKDQKRIEHALTVLKYAEQIQQMEKGNLLVVKAAAILHDIGIQRAETVHNSAAGKYQEIEGPPIAREIMKKLEMPEEIMEQVCNIIANHHSARDKKTAGTIEFQIIWDADWLVNLPEVYPDCGPEETKQIIEKIFKTTVGRQLAGKVFEGT